jgi:hypothetical protein
MINIPDRWGTPEYSHMVLYVMKIVTTKIECDVNVCGQEKFMFITS